MRLPNAEMILARDIYSELEESESEIVTSQVVDMVGTASRRMYLDDTFWRKGCAAYISSLRRADAHYVCIDPKTGTHAHEAVLAESYEGLELMQDDVNRRVALSISVLNSAGQYQAKLEVFRDKLNRKDGTQ